MVFRCLSSGSEQGNCYTLTDSKGEVLILDCGISEKDVKIGINFQIAKVKGVLVTHIHEDHIKSADKLKKIGLKVLRPFDNDADIKPITLGDYYIQPFELTTADGTPTHSNGDSTPCRCFGYFIKHPELGKMVYITDTYLIKQNFSKVKLNHILVSANYDENAISDDLSAKDFHILQGHMSIQNLCSNFLVTSNSDELKNVILCHLSKENAEKNRFKEMAQEVVDCNVAIATKGVEIKL
jgi:phosphoribosyl 1,2-cyclic phosphodiesterase